MTKTKTKPKKQQALRYVPIDKVTRWQTCQNIAKLLYWSNAEDVQLAKIMAKLQTTPFVARVVKIINNLKNEAGDILL